MFNFNFRRFIKTDKFNQFSYKQYDNTAIIADELKTISMDKAGFNLYTVVQNYMAESVLLGGNLSATPTKIKTLLRDNSRQRDDTRNYVIVTIYSSQNMPDYDPRKRVTYNTKTEIRIPGRMLNQGSVFIEELDCYLMTESMIDPTRKLLAQEILGGDWDRVNVPSSMAKQDPAVMYEGYKDLVDYCISRQDKISVRVGVDLERGAIPDIIKTMRIAILDSYFVPYKDYKLVYDSSLGEDEFVIENLHLSSRDEFRSTFSDLKELGSIYLDRNEIDTLFGKFYGVALFSNEASYSNYVYKRKTLERFDDETLYVAERSGDPKLKEKIEVLERDLTNTQSTLAEKNQQITNLTDRNKILTRDLKEREEAITAIRKNHTERMSAPVVLREAENEQQRLFVESQKIIHESEELKHKERIAVTANKVAIWKNIADIMKSGWGILTASIGGIAAVIAICKKYGVRLTMAK